MWSPHSGRPSTRGVSRRAGGRASELSGQSEAGRLINWPARAGHLMAPPPLLQRDSARAANLQLVRGISFASRDRGTLSGGGGGREKAGNEPTLAKLPMGRQLSWPSGAH